MGSVSRRGANTSAAAPAPRSALVTKLASGDCASPGDYAAAWNFGYDGDGTRVSQLCTAYVDGEPQTPVFTAYFMGGACEVFGTLEGSAFASAGLIKY